MPESELFQEIASLQTEQNNPRTTDIDTVSAAEILTMINDEDLLVAPAVRKCIPQITEAVERISTCFYNGGRLFYIGAGTSGRLGIVDASECPPTFGSDAEMVQGIIAGGKEAVFKAQEGAEDLYENGEKEIISRKITKRDVVCGIAASGRTPFVRGALAEARRQKIFTILLTTGSNENIKDLKIEADIIINPQVGAEVVAGSTRMKSGTAQKLVLNMLTTASMILIGKTYGNIMIDLQLTNAKLKERAKRTIMSITGISYQLAEKYLLESGGHVKTALVMILADVDAEKAKKMLEESGGFIKKAILS